MMQLAPGSHHYDNHPYRDVAGAYCTMDASCRHAHSDRTAPDSLSHPRWAAQGPAPLATTKVQPTAQATVVSAPIGL